jgi:hypothetical protein
MAGKTRRFLFAVTAGVWVTALGSAAALAYVLDRPLQPRMEEKQVAAAPAPRESVDQVIAAVRPSAPVLQIPPITIVGSAPAKRAAFIPKPVKPAPDITEMNCSQWRDLQMGSGRVQVCESAARR